jgi:regulator of sirC expression with transglutaminase-like and TPR domain
MASPEGFMSMGKPMYCRPGAYALFRSQMRCIESLDGLLTAANAVAMHELPDIDPARVNELIDGYARQVRSRVRSSSIQAKLAHLHDVLFEEAGFVGNSDDYYNPHNSYIPSVLESKRGLPITLSMIYKVVAERVGLRVEGINAPLHFMAGVLMEDKLMLVDPFFGGRVVSRDEAFDRIEQASGRVVARVDELLPRATHRQWMARLLQNLMSIFEHTQQHQHRNAILELRGVLMTEA